jgi:hypothetical protein
LDTFRLVTVRLRGSSGIAISIGSSAWPEHASVIRLGVWRMKKM